MVPQSSPVLATCYIPATTVRDDECSQNREIGLVTREMAVPTARSPRSTITLTGFKIPNTRHLLHTGSPPLIRAVIKEYTLRRDERGSRCNAADVTGRCSKPCQAPVSGSLAVFAKTPPSCGPQSTLPHDWGLKSASLQCYHAGTGRRGKRASAWGRSSSPLTSLRPLSLSYLCSACLSFLPRRW